MLRFSHKNLHISSSSFRILPSTSLYTHSFVSPLLHLTSPSSPFHLLTILPIHWTRKVRKNDEFLPLPQQHFASFSLLLQMNFFSIFGKKWENYIFAPDCTLLLLLLLVLARSRCPPPAPLNLSLALSLSLLTLIVMSFTRIGRRRPFPFLPHPLPNRQNAHLPWIENNERRRMEECVRTCVSLCFGIHTYICMCNIHL